MKKIVLTLIVLSELFLFVRCKDDSFKETVVFSKDTSLSNNSSDLKSLQSENALYDKDIRNFAKALAKSMANINVRKLIKSEAMQKIDGDFDIMWKDFKYKTLDDNGVEIRLLEHIARKADDVVAKTKDIKKEMDDLEVFGANFKKLQISVPVNCIAWDPLSFEPLVVYITSDYKESQDEVEAYNSKGEVIKISNKVFPDKPVVVVNLNERSDNEGNTLRQGVSQLKSAQIIIEGAQRPTGLIGASSMVGIHLNWNYTGGPFDQIEIQRNSGSGYTTIAVVDGDIFDYLDSNNLSNGNTYYYRLRSWSSTYNDYSPYTNGISVTFIPIPSPPSNFSTQNTSSNQMFLSWSNTLPYSYNSNIIIKRRIVGQSDFQAIATLPTSTNSYLDQSLTANYPSNLYHYQIYYQTGSGVSDAAFDIEYCSQRSIGQPLYLNSILVPNIEDIESWVYGAPEFDISIATMNTAGSTPIMLKSKYRYEPALRLELVLSGYEGVYNPRIAILDNWDKDFAQSVMSINIVEYDGEWFSGSLNVNVGVKVPFKEKTAGIINVGATGNLQLSFKSSDKDLNTEYVYYWENPIVWRNYSNGIRAQYGNVQEVISQNPNMVFTW